MASRLHAIANGTRTEHPVPDLPFVEDAHIPIEDPTAIEAVGRHSGTDMWGREDSLADGGWVAITTDPIRHDLAWVVRFDPKYGRSVSLHRDEDAWALHATYCSDPAVLFRAGGYWWDGTTWYRPPQIWDGAAEEYLRRLVPGALTVTANDLLHATNAHPQLVQPQQIVDVDVDAPTLDRPWADQLAWWARRQDGGRPLADCIATLIAPELAGDQLLGAAEVADIAGIAASTLRAYVARGENDVPEPQAVINRRLMWSRPVAQEWAEARRSSSDSLNAIFASQRTAGPRVSPGVADLFDRFRATFHTRLWRNPDRRKRWAIRWRSEDAVQDIADDLAWAVVGDLRIIISAGDLAVTVRHAVLDELASGRERHTYLKAPNEARDSSSYGIAPPVARMIDWLVRYEPSRASDTLQQIVGEAERRLEMPRGTTVSSLRTALQLDSRLSGRHLGDFLDTALKSVMEGATEETQEPPEKPQLSDVSGLEP